MSLQQENLTEIFLGFLSLEMKASVSTLSLRTNMNLSSEVFFSECNLPRVKSQTYFLRKHKSYLFGLQLQKLFRQVECNRINQLFTMFDSIHSKKICWKSFKPVKPYDLHGLFISGTGLFIHASISIESMPIS